MPLRIVLVRHGLSSFNLEQRFQGRDDLSTLVAEGARQARAVGEALKELPLTAAYSSPLSRARDTTNFVLACREQSLEPCFDNNLLEIDLAAWSGLRRSEVRQLHPEQEQIWRQAPECLELRRQDGSTYRPLPELLQQAQAFLEQLLRRHGEALEPKGQATALVVAHNAILRCLILQACGLPISSFRRLRLENASISVLNLERVSSDSKPQVQIESINGTTHLDEPLPQAGPGPRLLLVRHGETDWNREGRFQGQIDIPLNSNGLVQAEAARRFLAEVPIQRAYTSPMARPRQTAERIILDHPGVPLTSNSGLVEIGHGLWEGQLEQQIAEAWPELLARWKTEPQTVQMPEGETLRDVCDRSLGAWNRIASSLAATETALVVAHDAVNKMILCSLLGLGPEAFWAIKQGNGGVTVVDYPQGAGARPVLTCLNLTAHLGGVLDRTAAGAL